MKAALRPDVKICGVCDPADAAHAVAAGATHVGVVRVPGSLRERTPELVARICAAAEGAKRVGVYVDAATARIVAEAKRFGLDVVQLHGREPPEQVEALLARGLEVWKVVKPRTAEELLTGARRWGEADLLLVEGYSRLGPGGVGARLNWAEVAAGMSRLPSHVRVGVAGGLDPENVAAAVRRLRPALVDVSSGVESLVGRKDPALVTAFVAAARAAAEQRGTEWEA